MADSSQMEDTSAGGGKEASLSDTAGDRNAARSGLIGLNNLTYRLEPDMSVAVNCTDKNHFFQQQTYENSQRAVCVLNSGADYIDPRRSFLCFTIKLPDIIYGHTAKPYIVGSDHEMHERITFGKQKNNN